MSTEGKQDEGEAAPVAPAEPKKAERAPKTPKRPERGDALFDAWAALDRGDHVEARALAKKVAEDTDASPALRGDARDFLARLAPDSMVVGIFLATAALMLALALTWLGRR